MRRNLVTIFCILIGIVFLISCISDSEAARRPKPRCGDRICNGTETCSTCPRDCGVCPPPAPYCGDGTCNGTETCSTCSTDCGVCPPVCGDGSCNGTETCKTCSQDCGTCPPAPLLNITLGWDANVPEDNVTNYKIYYGYQSGVYSGSYDTGTNLSLALTLEQQKVYYFSATASNTVGESGYSNEITYSTMYNYW